MFVDIPVHLGAVVLQVIGDVQPGSLLLFQDGGELRDNGAPALHSFHQELDQCPPRTLEQKAVLCLPKCIGLDLFEQRQLFPDLGDAGFALQKSRGATQLLFGILERGHLLDLDQHHAIDEVIEPLGKFVRFRRLDLRRSLLHQLGLALLGEGQKGVLVFVFFQMLTAQLDLDLLEAGVHQLRPQSLVRLPGKTTLLQRQGKADLFAENILGKGLGLPGLIAFLVFLEKFKLPQ